MSQQKKWIWYAVVVLLSFLLFGLKVQAEETQTIKTVESHQNVSKDEVIHYGMGMLDWESIEALEKELTSAMPEGMTFDLKGEVEKLIKGQTNLSVSSVLDYIGKALFNEIGVFLQLGARFILMVLLCNLLQTLSSSFKAKDTVKIAFFVCYMAILLSVVQSFRVMIQLAMAGIDQMTQVMLVCLPILLAFMASSGFSVSASAMAPVVLSALSIMSYVIKTVVLPCIISVVVLEVISAMSEEFKVSKLIGLFYKGLKWGLRSILAVGVGILSLYRLTLPGVDSTIKQATVKFSSLFIPVVGSAVGDTIEFITKCSVLIKNSFSAGIIMWVLLLASIPLIKIFAYVCVYQIAGAIIEPLGDKKMANIATKLGKGCQFIMSSVGIVVLLCVCALIICMTISSNGI